MDINIEESKLTVDQLGKCGPDTRYLFSRTMQCVRFDQLETGDYYMKIRKTIGYDRNGRWPASDSGYMRHTTATFYHIQRKFVENDMLKYDIDLYTVYITHDKNNKLDVEEIIKEIFTTGADIDETLQILRFYEL